MGYGGFTDLNVALGENYEEPRVHGSEYIIVDSTSYIDFGPTEGIWHLDK